MACEHLQLGPFTSAIVCTRGRAPKPKPCRWCTEPSTYACDHPVKKPSGKDGTCDAPMCVHHAKQTGADRHACPDHFVPRKVRCWRCEGTGSVSTGIAEMGNVQCRVCDGDGMVLPTGKKT